MHYFFDGKRLIMEKKLLKYNHIKKYLFINIWTSFKQIKLLIWKEKLRTKFFLYSIDYKNISIELNSDGHKHNLGSYLTFLVRYTMFLVNQNLIVQILLFLYKRLYDITAMLIFQFPNAKNDRKIIFISSIIIFYPKMKNDNVQKRVLHKF